MQALERFHELSAELAETADSLESISDFMPKGRRKERVVLRHAQTVKRLADELHAAHCEEIKRLEAAHIEESGTIDERAVLAMRDRATGSNGTGNEAAPPN